VTVTAAAAVSSQATLLFPFVQITWMQIAFFFHALNVIQVPMFLIISLALKWEV
jgi:hypothetical protein